MNDIDKKLCNALKEFSRFKKKNYEEIKDILDESMINTLYHNKYVSELEGIPIITTKGLEELRKLESIKLNEGQRTRANFALGLSILAMIIAILTYIYK